MECVVSVLWTSAYFLKIEEGLEGLAHISEIDWGFVDNPKTICARGRACACKGDWKSKDAAKYSFLAQSTSRQIRGRKRQKKYAKDQIVDGVVIKFNKHGALVLLRGRRCGTWCMSPNSAMRTNCAKRLDSVKHINLKFQLELKDQRMTLSYKDRQSVIPTMLCVRKRNGQRVRATIFLFYPSASVSSMRRIVITTPTTRSAIPSQKKPCLRRGKQKHAYRKNPRQKRSDAVHSRRYPFLYDVHGSAASCFPPPSSKKEGDEHGNESHAYNDYGKEKSESL